VPGSRPYEQVTKHAVLGREDRRSVYAVPIEKPAGQQDGRSLVALAKPLCPHNPVREDRRGPDRVLNGIDGSEGPLDTRDVVWLVEPLVFLADRVVEREGEVKRRAPQWSCR